MITLYLSLFRFYCDSSSGLDEHNRSHSPSTFTKLAPEQPVLPPIPISSSIKSSELTNGVNNSEKSTPPSKAKVHRCRQCSFTSSVKVNHQKIVNRIIENSSFS